MWDRANSKVKVIVDRPMGSRHPEHGFIYPVNYGYVPGTFAEDGEEIDAYVLGEFEPLDSYDGLSLELSSTMMTTRINWLSHGM